MYTRLKSWDIAKVVIYWKKKKTFVQISLAICTNIFGNLAKDKLDTHMCAATEVYRSWRADILLKF